MDLVYLDTGIRQNDGEASDDFGKALAGQQQPVVKDVLS